ncbi:MAG: hypothetical protein AB7P24_21225 [Nitrospira sp.]
MAFSELERKRIEQVVGTFCQDGARDISKTSYDWSIPSKAMT